MKMCILYKLKIMPVWHYCLLQHIYDITMYEATLCDLIMSSVGCCHGTFVDISSITKSTWQQMADTVGDLCCNIL